MEKTACAVVDIGVLGALALSLAAKAAAVVGDRRVGWWVEADDMEAEAPKGEHGVGRPNGGVVPVMVLFAKGGGGLVVAVPNGRAEVVA